MNRRSMFRALVGAPLLPLLGKSETAPKVEQFAFAPVTTCTVCGGAVIYLDPRGLLRHSIHLVQCGAPECPNHWPWIQEDIKATRASAKVKALVDEMHLAHSALSTATFEYRYEFSSRHTYEWYTENEKARELLRHQLDHVHELIAKELA